MSTVEVNPECAAGKHANCDRRALSDDGDVHLEACPCPCHLKLPPAEHRVIVAGHPAPQGSKSVGRNGRIFDVAKGLAPWRKLVHNAAVAAQPAGWQPIDGPVEVQVVFTMPRPKHHYRTGRYATTLRDNAPQYPIVKGRDLDKLVRAVLDALTTAGTYHDDQQVVHLHAYRFFVEVYPGQPYGAIWRVPGGGAVIEIDALA